MKKIETINELKQVQLNILISIHEFCVDHNINYSLSCGTLLGAIRHKGYIPWDDDIDIQLTRPEYNKLVKEFPAVFNNISLFSLERTIEWNRPYARAFNNQTIEKEGTNGDLEGIGVGIDVFPIDNVPNDNDTWIRYNRSRLILQNAYQVKMMRWSKNRSFGKNLALLFFKIPLVPFSLQRLSLMIDRLAQQYNNDFTDFLYENCQGIGNGRKRFLSNDFAEYIDVEFEGHYLKSIKGYDDYLKNTYGNYMELPPVEKRISTHTFEAYWKV